MQLAARPILRHGGPVAWRSVVLNQKISCSNATKASTVVCCERRAGGEEGKAPVGGGPVQSRTVPEQAPIKVGAMGAGALEVMPIGLMFSVGVHLMSLDLMYVCFALSDEGDQSKESFVVGRGFWIVYCFLWGLIVQCGLASVILFSIGLIS